MSSTVAAIIGMIPEGLYLLVSVALAVSVISLAPVSYTHLDMLLIGLAARRQMLH